MTNEITFDSCGEKQKYLLASIMIMKSTIMIEKFSKIKKGMTLKSDRNIKETNNCEAWKKIINKGKEIYKNKTGI